MCIPVTRSLQKTGCILIMAITTAMNEVQMIIAGDSGVLERPAGRLQLRDRAANEENTGTHARPRSGFGNSLQTTAGYLLLLIIVYVGWQHRGNVYITPEEGAGYALGIAGGCMLLLLLMYPLRKHLRWMRSFGPVRYWFRAHMLLGIIGPVCILYHCNFQLGSANGNIALISMLLVAVSGLAGRYFYTKLHFGLYGKRADLERLSRDGALAMSSLGRVLEAAPGLTSRLHALERRAVAAPQGILPGLMRVLAVGLSARMCWIMSGPALRKTIRRSEWGAALSAGQRRVLFLQARYYLQIYLQTVCKVSGLAFFEKLFSLWHILHLPLFLMLLITGVVHVYAVHMY